MSESPPAEATPDLSGPLLAASAECDESNALINTLRARTIALNVEVRQRDGKITDLLAANEKLIAANEALVAQLSSDRKDDA